MGCLADCLGVLLGCLAVLGEAAWLLSVRCLAALWGPGDLVRGLGYIFGIKMEVFGIGKCG